MLGNWLKTTILMAAIVALFGAIGSYLGGANGMLLALLFGGAMNFFSYWNADRMVLSMYGAKEVDERSAPEYYGIVRDLAKRAGLPMPRVFVINSDQPNAFCVPRKMISSAMVSPRARPRPSMAPLM